MNKLADENIVLSKKGDAGISSGDAASLLARLPGWAMVDDDGIEKLVKEYSSKDYPLLLTLAGKIGAIAEQANHHPVIVIEWGKVTVSWWTHTIKGLHRNDFIMAARCDRVAMLVTAP